jgi:uncharacterized membrane protein
MNEKIELLLIYIHILSALYWVGGNLLFFSFGYSLRKIYKDSSLIPGFRALGRTFRVGSWISVILLTITGIILLIYRWGGLNKTIILKLVLFLILLPLKFLHDFLIAPRAAKEVSPSFYYQTTMVIARLNLFLMLLIIYFSMILVR